MLPPANISLYQEEPQQVKQVVYEPKVIYVQRPPQQVVKEEQRFIREVSMVPMSGQTLYYQPEQVSVSTEVSDLDRRINEILNQSRETVIKYGGKNGL